MKGIDQPKGLELINKVKEIQGSKQTLISYSLGKDSICAWLGIRDHFEEITPFYLYLVPGLEFVEKELEYHEKILGTHIIRLPAPNFYKMLNEMVYQPPQRCEIIEAMKLPKINYMDIRQALIDDYDLPDNIMYATGVRAADSPMRRTVIKKYGPITANAHKYHPVWDWNKERLITEIKKAKIRLPVDYKYFSRTFDGIDLRFLYNIKINFPKDYEKILEWFPLADMEIFRYEAAKKRGLTA